MTRRILSIAIIALTLTFSALPLTGFTAAPAYAGCPGGYC